jgi:hypothetical protein
MARIGSNIQANLGRIDYSPLFQGMSNAQQFAAQGNAALAQSISNLGQIAGSTIQGFQKYKEEEKLEKNLGNVEINTLKTNIAQSKNETTKDLYINAPKVDQAKIDELNRRVNSSDPAERKAAIVELSTINQGFKEAPIAALRNIQFESAQNALAQQKQERKNLEAMSIAISGLPTTISDTRTVERPVVTQREAMMNQSPELFPFLREQPMAQPSQATPVGNVPNKIPANLDPFLFPDTIKGQYALRTDLIDQTTQRLNTAELEAKRRMDALEQPLKTGKFVNPLDLRPAGGDFAAKTPQRVPLSSTEYEMTLREYDKAKADYQSIVDDKKKFSQLSAEAGKLAGAPLEVPAGKLPSGAEPIDEISGAIAKATGRSEGNVRSVIEPEYKTELRSYEEKVNRPLTGAEKAQKILLAYEKGGGQITPKVIADVEKMTQDQVRVIKSGNLTFVSVGGAPFEMVKSNAPSVSQLKYDDTQEFALLVDALSQGDSLESFDPEVVARARRAYITRPQTNTLTGTVMNFEEYINSLRPASRRQQNAGLVVPITPSAANQASGRTSSGLQYSATIKPSKG